MSHSESSYSLRRRNAWEELIGCASDSGPPQCDGAGVSVLLSIGAGFHDRCAPGFEYCLDAPVLIPAGSHVCVGVQPIMD